MVSAETGGREGKRARHADRLPSATSCLCRPSSVTGLAVTHTGVRPASSRAALCGARRCSRWPAAGCWRAWGPAWPPSTRLHAHSPRAAPVLPLPGLLRHSAPPRSARTCGADVLPCRGPTCVSGPCRFPRSAGASCFRPSPPSSVRSPRGASPLTKAAALPCRPQGPLGVGCVQPRVFDLHPRAQLAGHGVTGSCCPRPSVRLGGLTRPGYGGPLCGDVSRCALTRPPLARAQPPRREQGPRRGTSAVKTPSPSWGPARNAQAFTPRRTPEPACPPGRPALAAFGPLRAGGRRPECRWAARKRKRPAWWGASPGRALSFTAVGAPHASDPGPCKSVSPAAAGWGVPPAIWTPRVTSQPGTCSLGPAHLAHLV